MSQSRITFEATLDEKGGLLPDNGAVIRARLSKWAKRRVFVAVKKDHQPKTNAQLGYYFGVVLPFAAEYIGDDEDAVDDDLRLECFPKRERSSKLTGEVVVSIPRLKYASKGETSEFLDRVLVTLAKIGCYPPEPGEATEAL